MSIPLVEGQQGVGRARSDAPDIVLLDVNLSIKDGRTAARNARGSPEATNRPVVALTAQAMSGGWETAVAAGCDNHPRPLDFSRLVEPTEALAGRRMEALAR